MKGVSICGDDIVQALRGTKSVVSSRHNIFVSARRQRDHAATDGFEMCGHLSVLGSVCSPVQTLGLMWHPDGVTISAMVIA